MKRLYINVFKRIIDLTISFLAFLILSPVILFLIAILTITSKKKPFFLQERPGKNEKIFKLIKFRTMNDKRDSEGTLLPDHLRLTTTGKLLRSTSLDELPQLFNVLKGDMSIVGPRPLLIKYLPLYSKEQARRHSIKPGITGLAQVSGRNLLNWDEKFKLDVWYADHVSFLLDMKIIFKTILKVIRRDGINSSESATMEAFKGN